MCRKTPCSSHIAYDAFCAASHLGVTPACFTISRPRVYEMSLPRRRDPFFSSYAGYHQSEYPPSPMEILDGGTPCASANLRHASIHWYPATGPGGEPPVCCAYVM